MNEIVENSNKHLPPLLVGKNIKSIYITWNKKAGAELGQAQLKLELELCYTCFEILSYR